MVCEPDNWQKILQRACTHIGTDTDIDINAAIDIDIDIVMK